MTNNHVIFDIANLPLIPMNAQGNVSVTYRNFFFLFLLVSLPIFIINLGVVPFIEDEGIRGLVALEMLHSGNYIAPTLYGEPYFKKPPLWNWVLVGSYRLFGNATELTTRIPTIAFLFLFTISIYFATRKYIGEQKAVLSALLFLTCGRILFWDSMLGLIDIMFSWMIFLLFVWIFHFHKKCSWLTFYLGVYTLTSVAFMLKALPSLVFLGLTLLATHTYYKSWKRLASWQHLAGIALFCVLIGSYLTMYAQEQPISQLLSVFLKESTQRTAIKYGLVASILQFGKFPFEMMYHFLPWSLLTLLLFQPNLKSKIFHQPFVAFTAVIFLVNIFVYWSSPEVYPRYLFMFAPLFFIIFLNLYWESKLAIVKMVDISLCLVAAIVLVGSLYVFFNDQTKGLTGIWWKWAISAIPMAFSLLYMIKSKKYRLYSLCVFLLAARLGFSLIVLPVRGANDLVNQTRQDAVRIAETVGSEALKLYQHDTMRYEAGFYLTAQRGKPISITRQATDEAYLLVNLHKYATLHAQFEKVDSMRVKREEKYVYLVRGSGNK